MVAGGVSQVSAAYNGLASNNTQIKLTKTMRWLALASVWHFLEREFEKHYAHVRADTGLYAETSEMLRFLRDDFSLLLSRTRKIVQPFRTIRP